MHSKKEEANSLNLLFLISKKDKTQKGLWKLSGQNYSQPHTSNQEQDEWLYLQTLRLTTRNRCMINKLAHQGLTIPTCRMMEAAMLTRKTTSNREETYRDLSRSKTNNITRPIYRR